jgi:hypothetical protein
MPSAATAIATKCVPNCSQGYEAGWTHKIVIGGGLEGRYNQFRVVRQAPDGGQSGKRLDYRRFLRLVAAVNFKQRIRKTLEYYRADRLNYAVVGTPNRLEFDDPATFAEQQAVDRFYTSPES